MTQSMISDLETGEVREPSVNTVSRWAEALDCEATIRLTVRMHVEFPIRP